MAGAKSLAPVNLQILNLADCPEQLERVAGWHQQAWGSGSVAERLEKLKAHIVDHRVPVSWVGFVNSVPVTTVSLVHYQRLGESPHSLWAANLYVEPQWRRQGIGEQMLRVAKNCAAEQGESRCYLFTTDQEAYYGKRDWRVLRRSQFRSRSAAIMYCQL